jgi:hypothetical protein
MNIDFGSIGVNIQAIPIYGLSLGFLYYNPNLEPDSDNVDDEDFYQQVTIMCLLVGLHITVWRY